MLVICEKIIRACPSYFCRITKGTLYTLSCSFAIAFRNITKNTKILRDITGTILINYSPKRENMLGSIEEPIECENDSNFHANDLLKLSETR